MCEWGNTVPLYVPIPAELSHTGQFRWDWKLVDRCIAPIVDALNKAGIWTASCCCGHGGGDGVIALHDGRELIVRQPHSERIDREMALEQLDEEKLRDILATTLNQILALQEQAENLLAAISVKMISPESSTNGFTPKSGWDGNLARPLVRTPPTVQGWRCEWGLLEKGETIQQGDEALFSLGWMPCISSIGKVVDGSFLPIRRRLAPAGLPSPALVLLKRLEWCLTCGGDEESFGCCPMCGGVDFRGHKDNCEMRAIFLAAERKTTP